MISLFSPYQLSSKIKIKNRIVMAPMTRRKADTQYNPTDIMIEYYAKRADAGLIITEGTLISKDALGYGNVPGIFTEKHIENWRKITEAVHQKGGIIFLQLWHCGRISHPSFHEGRLPLSPSATTLNIPLGKTGYNCGPSRAATKEDIFKLISDYAEAAKNAIHANFDGVEIHGANGYLPDQFLHYCSNFRDDEYGLTPENMARFPLDIVKACGSVIGFERVGLRLSPGGHMNEIITESRDAEIFNYLLNEIEKLKIAYIHTGVFDDSIVYKTLNHKTATAFLRSIYKQNIIASGNYNLASASQGIQNDAFDLISFGRSFIANPDLIKLLQENKPLQEYSPGLLESLY